jgi:hypothetical protein
MPRSLAAVVSGCGHHDRNGAQSVAAASASAAWLTHGSNDCFSSVRSMAQSGGILPRCVRMGAVRLRRGLWLWFRRGCQLNLTHSGGVVWVRRMARYSVDGLGMDWQRTGRCSPGVVLRCDWSTLCVLGVRGFCGSRQELLVRSSSGTQHIDEASRTGRAAGRGCHRRIAELPVHICSTKSVRVGRRRRCSRPFLHEEFVIIVFTQGIEVRAFCSETEMARFTGIRTSSVCLRQISVHHL